VRDRLATLDHANLRRHLAQLLRAHTHEQAEAMLNDIVEKPVV
jgi:phosphotransferase system enzyme I (PtsI)